MASFKLTRAMGLFQIQRPTGKINQQILGKSIFSPKVSMGKGKLSQQNWKIITA
jgi:hypothetical protein